jgi:hypothetical protein
MQVAWTILKGFVSTRYISIQYLDLGDAYWLKAFDDLFELECNLPKGIDDADTLDFENNFKSSSNKPVQSPLTALNCLNFRSRYKGVREIVPHGETKNIDHTLSAERWLTGLKIILDGKQVAGDTVQLQVVHPTYGVVDQFGDTWNVSDKSSVIDEMPGYAARLQAGLTLRVAYTSTGPDDVSVGVNYKLHWKTA